MQRHTRCYSSEFTDFMAATKQATKRLKCWAFSAALASSDNLHGCLSPSGQARNTPQVVCLSAKLSVASRAKPDYSQNLLYADSFPDLPTRVQYSPSIAILQLSVDEHLPSLNCFTATSYNYALFRTEPSGRLAFLALSQ